MEINEHNGLFQATDMMRKVVSDMNDNAGKHHPPAKKKNRGNQLFYEGGYTKMPKVMLDEDITKTQQNKTMLWWFLWEHVWTISSERDAHNIHYRYYVMRKTLATSWAESVLAQYFDVTDRTIRNWITALKSDGILRTEQDPQHKGQVVFMFGEYDEDGKVTMYSHRKESSADTGK